jgi:hypothetical protein
MQIKNKAIKNIAPDKKYNPQTGLWRAVITQAVMDTFINSKRTSEILAKKNATEWLNINNPNFIMVCDFAHLNPYWVLKKVRYALENPRLWRRECDLKNFFKNKESNLATSLKRYKKN